MPDPAPQRDAILAALERLLAWSDIARSRQLGKFLDYIVRRTLDGDEQSIKAYSIAVDVLGRRDDFDPQSDPIVRVQARRLRGLLDEYYRTVGSAEITRIHLPVGRYVPEFELGAVPVRYAERGSLSEEAALSLGASRFSRFALIVMAIGIVLAVYVASTWGQRQRDAIAAAEAIQPPIVTIVEFQNLADDGSAGAAVSGLAIELVTDLEQFENIDIRYGVSGAGADVTADLPASDYVLTGIVRRDGDVLQYSAILTDVRLSSVVWNYTISVPAVEATAADVLHNVARRFSLMLGSSRGPLHAAARRLLSSATPPLALTPYLCRILFDVYRDTGGAAEAERASNCVAVLPKIDQQSSVALAMSASLAVELVGPMATPTVLAEGHSHIADTSLGRAIAVSPISSFIWEQWARLHEGMGKNAAAQADFRSAIQLNPANADALAAYARLLALEGDLVQAGPMAKEAVEYAPNPPPWYQLVPALMALNDADYVRAIGHAELYVQVDRELGPILAIMAGQGAGDSAVVNRYLPQVLGVPAFRAMGVLPRLRQKIVDQALLHSINGALVSAGAPPNALTQPF